MEDLRYKGHFKGLDIAFTYAVTTQTVNEIIIRHNCDPIAAHILGRALTGALLSASILPEEQRMNVCWKYKGALKTIVVDAGQDGTVRGFISPAHLNDIEDINALYGDIGDVQTVISSDGKILNSGTAPVSLQDALKDLAFFHCISDQVETSLAAMIGFRPDPKQPVGLCHGWMLQALPNCDLERFDRIRRRMESPVFRDRLASANEPEETASILIGDEPDFQGVSMEACPAPRFHCPCSRDKIAAVVRTIPISDRMEIVKAGEPVTVQCQFCNERYKLSLEECIAAWNQK